MSAAGVGSHRLALRKARQQLAEAELMIARLDHHRDDGRANRARLTAVRLRDEAAELIELYEYLVHLDAQYMADEIRAEGGVAW